ncbi:unnamed protein product [Clonostachys chloroleuca]|uniref:Uncharacterized protein n=1 Tax=Clonostachys chloroleuca TaxID=1926264 RepID=A0AA35LZ38_9HYPO|nr:unnamed protein product [Clonostachys chloroleuca]
MADGCGSTCPVPTGFYSYDQSLVGDSILLAAYGILALAATYLGFRYRTPWFSATLAVGLLLEAIGFAGRLLLKGSPKAPAFFVLSMVGTVIGPPLMGGAIFLTLPHVIRVYGEHLSPVRPLLIGFVTYALAAVAMIVQVVGMIFVAYDFNGMGRTGGSRLVVGGLGIQLLSLLGFSVFHFWFMIGLSSQKTTWASTFSPVYKSVRFRRFLLGMEMVSLLLLTYTVYRIVEMAEGIHARLFQSQTAFMIVVGALPLTAALLSTIFHPGPAFGAAWGLTSSLRVDTGSNAGLPYGSPSIQSPLEQIQHQAHFRYDPTIRGAKSPPINTLTHPSRIPGPPSGLPISPRPGAGMTPIPSPNGTAWNPETGRYSMRVEKPLIPHRMVEEDTLW